MKIREIDPHFRSITYRTSVKKSVDRNVYVLEIGADDLIRLYYAEPDLLWRLTERAPKSSMKFEKPKGDAEWLVRIRAWIDAHEASK